MTQGLRDIRIRIKGVDNTRKITRAMEMVSAAKFNKVEDVLEGAHSYFTEVDALLKNIASGQENVSHPLLGERIQKNAVGLCIITSDTGLCAAYNDNIISRAENFLSHYDKEKIKLITVGKQGLTYFMKRAYLISKGYAGLFGRYSNAYTDEISKTLTDMFLSGEVDEVYVAYTHFVSKARRIASIEKFLNIEYKTEGPSLDFIFEPGRDSILNEVLAIYNINRMRTFILDSFASEHSARMITMKIATDNARDLIEHLILRRNKARQSMITKEVLEIISTAEALKGG